VEGVVWEGTADPAVSRQMKALYEADGADRSTPTITLAVLKANDEARRVEALSYIQAGKLASAADLFHAAVIFARGTCSDHQELAVRLAARAWERGSAEAWRIYQQTGTQWMEAQGKAPRMEEGRLRSWPVLEDLNRRLWAEGDGTFTVPLKLTESLEPRRGELEVAALAAQRRLRFWTKGREWDPHFAEGFFDRIAVFESKAELDRVVNQLREVPASEPVDPFLAASLEHRALLALSPEAAAALHPAFGGELGWEKLLTMAMARQLHRRAAGSDGAMGHPWFREGFAAYLARIPMQDKGDFSRTALQAIVDGRAPLDPQACDLLHRMAGTIPPADDAQAMIPQARYTVHLDDLQ
jgi:hypothetical protein